MKSFAIALAALVSVSAFAEDKHYWEARDPAPNEPLAPKNNDRQYWEQREVAPKDSLPAALDNYEAKAEKERIERHAHDADRKDLVLANDEQRKLTGISVEAGGGIGGFIDNRISNYTELAGQWTARVVFGTRSYLGGEVAYLGSTQGLNANAVGISNGAHLFGNGAEGAFRVNLLTGMWQPYGTVGVGWQHYSLSQATLTTSDVQQTGDVATFPMGVGMAWRMNGIVLDNRISFHPATSSGLYRGANMSTWDVNARAGFEF